MLVLFYDDNKMPLGATKTEAGSRKTAEKSGYTLFFILKIPWIHQRAAAPIKIQIWLENEKLAVPEVGFETRVNDGTC